MANKTPEDLILEDLGDRSGLSVLDSIRWSKSPGDVRIYREIQAMIRGHIQEAVDVERKACAELARRNNCDGVLCSTIATKILARGSAE